MCFSVLSGNGTILSRSSVQAISDDEFKTESILSQLQTYVRNVNEKLGDDIPNAELIAQPFKALYIWDEDDDIDEPIEPEASQEEEDTLSDNTSDQLLTEEVYLPQGDLMKKGKVVGYKRVSNGL
jgi:hypothetical protein